MASPQTKRRKHVHFSEGEQMGPPMPPSEGAKPAPQGPKTGPKHAKFPTSVHNQRVQGAMPPRNTNLPQKQGRTSQPAAREEVAATPGKLDSPNGLRHSRREKQPSKQLIEVMYAEIECNQRRDFRIRDHVSARIWLGMSTTSTAHLQSKHRSRHHVYV